LVVRWEGDRPVAVHVSRSPTDQGARRHEPTPGGVLVLDDLDPAVRYYVHLVRAGEDTVVVAERRVPLEGARNFRDLGGYVGADGRRVRWGAVYRSDHLGDLTDADRRQLDRLGIRTIVDFQGAHERDDPAVPPSVPAGIRRVEHPLIDGPADGVTFYQRVMDRTLTSFAVEDLTAFYEATLEWSAATFGAVLALLSDPTHLAAVFHCRAGKDRTGLTAALLLGALGVAEEEILDDYELTNRYRSGNRVEVLRPELAAEGLDIDDFLPLFVAPRRALADTLAGLRARHGSIEGYLTGPAGLGAEDLARLRTRLLG
jgi:protein-tyrosine phosphatase